MQKKITTTQNDDWAKHTKHLTHIMNWYGLWTLYRKEVQRFTNVGIQTIGAPVISPLLFFFIFTVSFTKMDSHIDGIPFPLFLIPGLITMAMLQNSFANTCSSLLISKVQGNIIDTLMAPLSPSELTIGFVLAGITRGLLVGFIIYLTMSLLVDMTYAFPWAIVYFSISGVTLLSLLGVIVGIWSEKFDHMQAVTNFVIIPLSFLSGTFFSITQLPEIVKSINSMNPFFHTINGFRYGFTGHTESNILIGSILLLILNIILFIICRHFFLIGYKIKS